MYRTGNRGRIGGVNGGANLAQLRAKEWSNWDTKRLKNNQTYHLIISVFIEKSQKFLIFFSFVGNYMKSDDILDRWPLGGAQLFGWLLE